LLQQSEICPNKWLFERSNCLNIVSIPFAHKNGKESENLFLDRSIDMEALRNGGMGPSNSFDERDK
jgi:hypothetical protein